MFEDIVSAPTLPRVDEDLESALHPAWSAVSAGDSSG